MSRTEKQSTPYVLDLQQVDLSHLSLVGTKAANLGEVGKLEGIEVPSGFCLTTEAFQQARRHTPAMAGLLDRFSHPDTAGSAEARDALCAQLRHALETATTPSAICAAVDCALARYGAEQRYAVRSSATAEDLPGASFAGQHDSYLEVVGVEAVLHHIRLCWASLFTERAVAYRNQQNFDHREVSMAVIVQRMVEARTAGLLFTADPLSGHRGITQVEATSGLADTLVAGTVNAERSKLRHGKVLERSTPNAQDAPLLSEAQLLRLEKLGRCIEAHFGCPQDIEWCLADERFQIVQSRPITHLFPTPERDDPENHVYISVGHQQMMTDPMKPLGLSMFQMLAGRPMFAAGGRLFVDVARDLASTAGRNLMLNVLGSSDPQIRAALTTIVEREGFLAPLSEEPSSHPLARLETPAPDDPAIVGELIAQEQASLQKLKQEIAAVSGPALLDFLEEDIERHKARRSGPQTTAAVMAGINASAWLNEKGWEWLGRRNVADVLSQSVANNVTSRMGLRLLDLADVLRPYPQVIAYLRTADGSLEGLDSLPGGQRFKEALDAYLEEYGMRCAGEIDITRPRWSEQPAALLSLLLSNLENFEAGEAQRRFEKGEKEASQLAESLLRQLEELPEGAEKARQTREKISTLRDFIGYREYPKYGLVSRTFLYKKALLREAEELVRAGILAEPEEVFYLTFTELRQLLSGGSLEEGLIQQRKAQHEAFQRLKPPRVFTSEGESVTGDYPREGVPSGALSGLAVSSGVVEGRARVLLEMAGARLEPGDILVTTFTDPGWTPLFLAVEALVTEVGGLMTHGAVIAREYGLPTVVGVNNATTLIRDGQRIRVNGTEGYVELLEEKSYPE